VGQLVEPACSAKGSRPGFNRVSGRCL